MSRREKSLATIGVALMLAGCVAPWAHTQAASAGARSVGGLGHGGASEHEGSVGAGLLVLLGRPMLAALCALAGAIGTALAMYELPGTLTAGAAIYQADVAWGAYLVLLGSVIAFGVTALRIVSRGDRPPLAERGSSA